MSKYTTEVRFICETAAGYDESKGYDDIDEIIEAAIPNIFDFEFPIFDPTYKNVICSKILMHYYTREIGLETVGLWKLKLRTKLNEVMPYYNQLYKSELLKFNPLYDTDLSTTNTGNKQGESNASEYKNIEHSEKENRTGTSVDNETRSGTGKSDNTSINTSDNRSDKTKSGSTNYTDAENKRNYDLYSDTPQGALNGVEAESYLTNARKVTDDATKVGNRNDSETEVDKNTETTATNENVRNSYDENNTRNNLVNSEGNIQKNESASTAGNNTYNSTESYVVHVAGKTGGNSFSKMLKEFRETFLNIDLEVINSLSDLFMNIW